MLVKLSANIPQCVLYAMGERVTEKTVQILWNKMLKFIQSADAIE